MLMKKILTFVFCAAMSLGAFASTVLFISNCGEMTYTVGPEFFETEEEAHAYYLELNELLCGN